MLRHSSPPARNAPQVENELEDLLRQFEDFRQRAAAESEPPKPDRIELLRTQMREELIPIFQSLARKYQPQGVNMRLDAAPFLNGGRELTIEFELTDWRATLRGTVTAEAIAFHERRTGPKVSGELTSGPALPLRQLTAESFREFICNRLSILVRNAMRYR